MLLVIAMVGVAVLSGAAGAVAANHTFADVPDGHAFNEEIGWMDESGISEGDEDGNFRPGRQVTRQAMDDCVPETQADRRVPYWPGHRPAREVEERSQD